MIVRIDKIKDEYKIYNFHNKKYDEQKFKKINLVINKIINNIYIMPFRIDKVKDGYKIYNLDKKQYTKKKI